MKKGFFEKSKVWSGDCSAVSDVRLCLSHKLLYNVIAY